MTSSKGKKVGNQPFTSFQPFQDDEPTDPEIDLNRLEAEPRANPLNLGVLDPYLRDPLITEVIVNDLRSILVEKSGQLLETPHRIETLEELNRLTRTIVEATGRVLSPDSPYVDVSLPDGSRVNIVGPPISMGGPCITIRKFPKVRFTLSTLLNEGSFDRKVYEFLRGCVLSRVNLLISGGTNSGKTTLLNALLTEVPAHERLVLVEDTPELTVPNRKSVRLRTKPQLPGSPAIGARELVVNSLRMRPDRIIVGECRTAEAFEVLQAMNTGHDGSMTTIHSNSTKDAIARLETLCMTAVSDIPMIAIRRQIASALDFLIQIRRNRNGKRQIVRISEITGLEGEIITLQEIFRFDDSLGSIVPAGFVPKNIDRINAALKNYQTQMPHSLFNEGQVPA